MRTVVKRDPNCEEHGIEVKPVITAAALSDGTVAYHSELKHDHLRQKKFFFIVINFSIHCTAGQAKPFGSNLWQWHSGDDLHVDQMRPDHPSTCSAGSYLANTGVMDVADQGPFEPLVIVYKDQ